MPKDKTETHQKIIPAAREEFLEKGFEQASMREIAAKVGISAAGLYRHFADKEALFAALVTPALEACREWYIAHRDWDYELLDQGKLEEMWAAEGDTKFIREIVYPYFDSLKLLLCCSHGTRYANFLQEIVRLEQEETEAFVRAAKKKGIPVREFRSQELSLLFNAYVTAVMGVVVHDFTLEEAEHYMKTCQEFFTPGWRAILGL